MSKENRGVFTWTNTLSVLLLLLSLWYYFSTLLTGDIVVNLASARLADIQYGGGLAGAVESWDLRIIAFRIYLYIHHFIAQFFVNIDHKYAFLTVVKMINIVLVLGAVYAFGYVIYGKNGRWHMFAIIFSILLLIPCRSVLEPEYVGFMFALIGIGLLVGNTVWRIVLGAFFLAVTVFLKGITVVFMFQALIMLWFYFDFDKKWIKTATTVFFVIAIFVAIAIFYPQEYVDIRSAMMFQSSMQLLGMGAIISLIHHGISFSIYYPLMIILPILFMWPFMNHLKEKKYWAPWVCLFLGCLTVLMQGQFFLYHFMAVFSGAFFMLPEVIKFISQNNKALIGFWMTCMVFFPCFILLNAPVYIDYAPSEQWARSKGSLWKLYSGISEWSYDKLQSQLAEVQLLTDYSRQLSLSEDTEVLYLDNGCAAWAVGRRSYLRYFFPLPLNRIKTNPDIVHTLLYRQQVKLLNSYKGKMVVYSDFVDIGDPVYALLRQRLETEYDGYKLSDSYMIFVRRK